MSKFQAVKGSAKSGFRDTHGVKNPPTNAPPEPGLGGGETGQGKRGAENVHGNAGNAQKSGTP